MFADFPARSDANAIDSPSGDHFGDVSFQLPPVSLRWFEPSSGNNHNADVYLSSSLVTEVTVATARVPSGETAGSPTVTMLWRSSMSRGRPVRAFAKCAEEDAAVRIQFGSGIGRKGDLGDFDFLAAALAMFVFLVHYFVIVW